MTRSAALTLVSAAVACGSPPVPADKTPTRDGGIAVTLTGAPAGVFLEKNVMVAMRDGVRLATDLYRPAGPGPFPVVLVRTPYGSQTADFAARGLYYVRHGYAFAVQNTRGKYDSEGDWYGKRDEGHDGSDAITWLGTRPWSSGKVGMVGPSYMGMVQYLVADQENPYLKALVPMAAPSTLGRDTTDFDQLAVYSGRESFQTNLTWTLGTDGRVNQMDPPGLLRVARRHRPLADYPKILGREMPWWPAMLDQRYGMWEQYYLRAAHGQWTGHLADETAWWGAYRERYRKVRVPMLHISGWYDCCDEQLIKTFQLIRELAAAPNARDHQYLIMGPWIHGWMGGRKEGEFDYGPLATFDHDSAAVRWFDHWLKGEDNGVEREPAVRAFVMGENRWREAKDWPIPGTDFAKFYLQSSGDARLANGGGTLSREAPHGAAVDHYRYDPANPTPEILTPDSTLIAGPADRSPIERREDVVVYSTDPLAAPVEVTGNLKVVLYLSTSAPSTDILARVVDVFPDGRAYNVFATYGATPYRTHWSKQVETGKDGTKIITAEIMLPPTSIAFATGHRIRLEISSAAAPTFFGLNVDPATDFTATKGNVADQTIYHDDAHRSHVVLPIIPR